MTSELKSSEQKYRQLINNASEGVVIVTGRKIVYFNPQASVILGISNHKPEEKLNVILTPSKATANRNTRRIENTTPGL